jgi:hypothetical protein
MHPDVHRVLDGELPREALSPAAAAELAEWELVAGLAAERRAERAPAWLADNVMRALPEPQPAATPVWQRAWQRAWQWLVTPRPLQVRPLAPLAGAAALLLVVLLQPTAPPAAAPAAAGEGAPVIYVQFALSAEGARSVAVAGDFNDWSVEAGALRDVGGDGVWRGLIAVQPGVHKYMFVVDGEEWVTDPVAERYVDDGFGMRNALLAVVAPGDVL